MERIKLRIGLFGYGCVGQGLHDVILSSGFKAEIVKICIKDRSKPRRLPADIFTTNAADILDDDSINLVVELTSDPQAAFNIVKKAMERGKSVVTAGKTMVANNMSELIALQQKHKVSLLYEASACGAIPVIRNLEEYYDNELLHSVEGIFNGSTNYILTKMYHDGVGYDAALEEAREKGFAEADPRLDVEGLDAKYKLCIIAGHAYGIFPDTAEVFNLGINNITEDDIRFAREKRCKIKLVATLLRKENGIITGFVMPAFVPAGDTLYSVDNEYNAVIAEAAFADRQLFYGKGAGGHATGCAVLSDISACSYGYRYEYKKREQAVAKEFSSDHNIEIYLRYENEEERELFAFEEVTEYFCGTGYNYIRGVINLRRLFEIKEQIAARGLSVINSGRVPAAGRLLLTTNGESHGKNEAVIEKVCI